MGAYNYGQVLYGELFALIHETANLGLKISLQSLCNNSPFPTRAVQTGTLGVNEGDVSI